MTIYVEMYLLKNLFFNFILLSLTAFFIKRKIKIYRLFLAALFGVMYAIFALYNRELFESALGKGVIGIIMLCITFGRKEILNTTSSFFIISYFIAGCIASLLHVKHIEILIFFIIVSVVLFLYFQKERKRNLYYMIEVHILNKKITLKAKLDTGNELKDKLFGKSVIVVSEGNIREHLEKDMLSILKNETIEIPIKYENRIKMIAFRTITEESIKIGIKLDRVIIYMKEGIFENNAVLILTKEKFNGYDALIGLSLLEKAYQLQYC